MTQPTLPAPLVPAKKTHLLAFHLPQFHPIPENDEWWGAGFTEWTNVTRGRPLYQGHYQPHLPADLGFYDLRLPEVREQQASLAREAGLGGFIYYHYWFNGRRLLERPVNEILRLKKPDFPFCFCWANEPWSRNWDGGSSHVLMPQSYSDDDDRNHIRWLLEAFADERYIKVDGKPLMLIYRPSGLPDMRRTAELWRSEAQRRGFPDLYLCSVRAFAEEFSDARNFGLDASVEFKPNGTYLGEGLTSDNPVDIGHRLHRVWDYEGMVEHALSQPIPDYPYHAGVCPCWDNSVRRKEGGMIFKDSSPEKYQRWLQEVLIRESLRPQQESLVLVNAWNEWAEGNHLEPCQRWGRAYLQATQAAVTAASRHRETISLLTSGQVIGETPGYTLSGNLDSKEIRADGIQVEGWCLENESLKPPALLAFAAAEQSGGFRLLSAIQHQRLPRADVATAQNTKHGITAGWRGYFPLTADSPPPECIRIVAVRERDGAVSSLTAL